MENLVIVRGGGDIATGTIYKLVQCGFRVLVLETANPSAIRRNVAFSEAVYNGTQTVEDLTCYLADSAEHALSMLEEGKLVMLVDPKGDCMTELKPMAVVDGILAKKNLGTHKAMAPITIALGPGFTAGEDVDAVIETMRGHSLGRVLYEGQAIKNTGVPGMVGGYTKERVIPANAEEIIIVCGLQAIGKEMKAVCHRPELVRECLRIEENTIITASHIQKLVQKGYVEPMKEKYPKKIL